MNRKIFTMLACALMLFSTAFYANARTVADKSVGALVKQLAIGMQEGVYHVQLDSIYLYLESTGQARFYPITYKGSTAAETYIQLKETSPGKWEFQANQFATSGFVGDTAVLSITEGGKVRMVNANDLKFNMGLTVGTEKANLADLQATMWCINVEDPEKLGFEPTFHFTSRIFGEDLDWEQPGITYVGGSDKGWMYSLGYNGYPELGFGLPFYRSINGDTEHYTVVKANMNGGTGLDDMDGFLLTDDIAISDFVRMNEVGTSSDEAIEGLIGMLKFSIVKVSPFVLTAQDFNSILGIQNVTETVGRTQLFMNKTTTLPNVFTTGWLRAEDPLDKTDHPYLLNYLKIQSFTAATGGTSNGYIYNEKGVYQDDNMSYKYLKLRTSTAVKEDDPDFNLFYRFVYFPSEDSLVINAFEVEHVNQGWWIDNRYWDQHLAAPATHRYVNDFANPPYYYGLFNDYLYDHLIVRYQDITTGGSNQSMVTIDNRQDLNARVYFGKNRCEDQYSDGWIVPKGLYTIWDDKGRALGVRIYNGSYTPQWLELEEGECPDRIPSYQWIVETSQFSQGRVTITNREFGGMPVEDKSIVQMENVYITREPSMIFRNQGQFLYSLIALQSSTHGYEPIVYGKVTGQLVAPITNTSACGIKSAESGFRPVTAEYADEQFLGYKHFNVNQEKGTVGYGKSENIGSELGMDYNAFAFNYLHDYTEDAYITLQRRFNNDLLFVKEYAQTGFQFIIAEELRRNDYKEENYGYPEWNHPGYPNLATPGASLTDWHVTISDPNGPGYKGDYTQYIVPLKRYFYELKIADFYNYRDSLAEQYVILNGAKNDGTDFENKKLYGVYDMRANREPFKFLNVYLRETYFLVRQPAKLGEERHAHDNTRRIFYALLDRIHDSQRHKLTEMGLEITDTLMAEDGSKYCIVGLAVQDFPAYITVQGKTVSSARVSTFALENINFELYRRIRSIEDDWLEEDLPDVTGLPNGHTAYDAPKVIRLYQELNHAQYLHEDAISDIDYGKGINFLGLANAFYHKEEIALDGTVKYNFNLYADTAFINRGTGPIKPQYLLAVGVDTVNARAWQLEKPIIITDYCLPAPPQGYTDVEVEPYIRARYLVNATDSARGPGSNGSSPIIRDEYALPANNDRLIFVDAIHAHDRLYIVSTLQKAGINLEDDIFSKYNPCDETWYLDMDAVKTEVAKLSDATLRAKGIVKNRKPGETDVIGIYYDFKEWDDYHNDVTFSLRFTEGAAKNANWEGLGGSDNFGKRFYIESETTNRTVSGNRKIAPVQGGWVRLHNDIPVLSRGSYEQAIGQADVFNIEKRRMDWQEGVPTGNDNVNAAFTVVGGIGEITLLNAGGKQVTVSNMLGQTLTTAKLASDNETLKVSKGVVIVTVAGENAVKTIVK